MCKNQLLSLLSALRALFALHQEGHWNVSGDPYYGDHILLQRLYEDTLGEEIDTLAEKITGTYGCGTIGVVEHVMGAGQFLVRWCNEPDLLLRSLMAEEDVQRELRLTFNTLKDTDELTLGMEDFLAATASSHETALYLLRQRCKK